MFKRFINWLAKDSIDEAYHLGIAHGVRKGFAAGVERTLVSLGSSKGKTADFEPANLGSTPSPRTKELRPLGSTEGTSVATKKSKKLKGKTVRR